jgi:hypothetical protein
VWGGGGPISWPPQSPDLPSLNFLFWEHVKTVVCETRIKAEEELIARMKGAFHVAGTLVSVGGISSTGIFLLVQIFILVLMMFF